MSKTRKQVASNFWQLNLEYTMGSAILETPEVVLKIAERIKKYLNLGKLPAQLRLTANSLETIGLVRMVWEKAGKVRRYMSSIPEIVEVQLESGQCKFTLVPNGKRYSVEKQHEVFQRDNEETFLWCYNFLNNSYTKGEITETEAQRSYSATIARVVPSSSVVEDPRDQVINLQRQVIDLQQELAENQQKFEKIQRESRKALHVMNQFPKRDKRLRKEYNDSLERVKMLKQENNILDLKVKGVESHITLYKGHANSGGFHSPISGQHFGLTNNKQPLRCTREGCKGYLTKKEYQQMNQVDYGAFCQTCRERPSSFEPDYQTAIVANLERFLTVVECNKGPLNQIMDLKASGQMDLVKSLTLPWDKTTYMLTPQPIYHEILPQPIETLILPIFFKGRGPKMSTELLNALMNDNILECLKAEEAKVEGAATWAKVSYPVEVSNYSGDEVLSEGEASRILRTRAEDLLIHRDGADPETLRLLSDEQLEIALTDYFRRERARAVDILVRRAQMDPERLRQLTDAEVDTALSDFYRRERAGAVDILIRKAKVDAERLKQWTDAEVDKALQDYLANQQEADGDSADSAILLY